MSDEKTKKNGFINNMAQSGYNLTKFGFDAVRLVGASGAGFAAGYAISHCTGCPGCNACLTEQLSEMARENLTPISIALTEECCVRPRVRTQIDDVAQKEDEHVRVVKAAPKTVNTMAVAESESEELLSSDNNFTHTKETVQHVNKRTYHDDGCCQPCGHCSLDNVLHAAKNIGRTQVIPALTTGAVKAIAGSLCGLQGMAASVAASLTAGLFGTCSTRWVEEEARHTEELYGEAKLHMV
jgi:hypothetical protein